MRHAGPSALDALEPLLEELRALPGLVERGRGIFYRRGRAFLHFHEDRQNRFADLRGAGDADFVRLPVSEAADWPGLLAAVRERLP